MDTKASSAAMTQYADQNRLAQRAPSRAVPGETRGENRFVRTLYRLPVDRVPIFEHVIDARFVHHAIGVNERSLNLAAEPFSRLARFMQMDVMTLGYRSRVEGTSTRADFAAMRIPDQADFLSRVDEFLRFAEGTDLGVNVYVHGPFDATYLSMGYEAFFYNLADDLSFVEEMMDCFTEDAVAMVEALIARGVTTIELVDDIAYNKGLFVRPELFRKLWLKRMESILAPIHAAKMPVFFHSDGDARNFIRMVLDLGFMGINPLEPQCNDIAALKKQYGADIVLMGNLEIGGALAFGTPAQVREEMKRLLAAMMPGYGYVAMSSNSLANCVVPENYMALVETVLKYGNY
jgi:uroporphyrinogen decarboxylase